MPKRVSAFNRALQEAQGSSDTSTEGERQASIPVEKQSSEIPVQKYTSTPVNEQNTGIEVQRQISIPGQQYTSEEVERNTSMPVQNTTSTSTEKQKLIKASYYISEDDDWKLEQIRIKRRRQGVKIDKSALIREAIGLLQE